METALNKIAEQGLLGVLLVLALWALYRLFKKYEEVQEKRVQEGLAYQRDAQEGSHILETLTEQVRDFKSYLEGRNNASRH